jgi:hypothetical protein
MPDSQLSPSMIRRKSVADHQPFALMKISERRFAVLKRRYQMGLSTVPERGAFLRDHLWYEPIPGLERVEFHVARCALYDLLNGLRNESDFQGKL